MKSWKILSEKSYAQMCFSERLLRQLYGGWPKQDKIKSKNIRETGCCRSPEEGDLDECSSNGDAQILVDVKYIFELRELSGFASFPPLSAVFFPSATGQWQSTSTKEPKIIMVHVLTSEQPRQWTKGGREGSEHTGAKLYMSVGALCQIYYDVYTINRRVVILLGQTSRREKLFTEKVMLELNFERRVGVCLLGKQRWKECSWQKKQ